MAESVPQSCFDGHLDLRPDIGTLGDGKRLKPGQPYARRAVAPRSHETRPRFMTAWCHGASGIGLARLQSLAIAESPDIRSEIEVAIETTLRHGFGHNHSLCHGDLGNLEEIGRASGR